MSVTSKSDDRHALMAWTMIAEPGEVMANIVLTSLGPAPALELISASAEPPDLPGLPAQALSGCWESWRRRVHTIDIEATATLARDLGIEFITPADPTWPVQLDDLGEMRPIALWALGDPTILTRPLAALVGARACSNAGARAAQMLAEAAVPSHVVCSGGAFGIDYHAHLGALAAQGQTLAVMAGGLDRLYPSAHTDLFNEIVKHGVIVSEMPVGARPTRWRFLQRNRIIAALADSVTIVEAAMRSGALSTARHALSLGRAVAAVPGAIESPFKQGCHELIRSGAELIGSVANYQQFLAENCAAGRLDLGATSATQDTAPDLFGATPNDSDPLADRVWEALPVRRAAAVEKLALVAGLSARQTLEALLRLQLQGRVRKVKDEWARKNQ